MNPSAVVEFVTTVVEPVPSAFFWGPRYRVAARLVDGTFLPCVVVQSKEKRVETAVKRLAETHRNHDQYVRVVEAVTAEGSSLAYWSIASLERSPFAWPLSTLQQIHGETAMSWTAFVVEMRDGRMYSYGTEYSTEFFSLPDGYTYESIENIHSGMVFSESAGMRPYHSQPRDDIHYLRDRPYFTCYVEGLEG